MQRKRGNKYGLEKNDRGIWHCDFSVAGRRLQRSTYTSDKAAAEEWCAALASRTWREIQLGEKPTILWEVAAAEWFTDKKADGKRDLANDRDKALILAEHLDGHELRDFHTGGEEGRGVDLNAVLDKLQRARGWANSTRNRHRSFVVGVMNHLRDKGFDVPHLKIARRREVREEPRALTHEEADRFIADLYESAVHIARPARFSLACGARQSNVTGLRWFQQRYAAGAMVPHVAEDLSRIIVPGLYFKNGKTWSAPLNEEAQEVLREARACEVHGHPAYVFTFYGQPIEQPYNTSFIAARDRQGLDGFNWHGLRHTWTTWHLEGGTPIEVVKELGGWSSLHILLKHYAHLTKLHVAKYAGNVRPTAKVTELRRIA